MYPFQPAHQPVKNREALRPHGLYVHQDISDYSVLPKSTSFGCFIVPTPDAHGPCLYIQCVLV